MVYKRCEEKGCKTSPRCDHYWHIKVTENGITERGPVTKYAGLLDATQELPRTKAQAEDLEAKVRVWMLRGRGPLSVTSPDAPTDPSTAPATLREACEAYELHHVSKMTDKSAASIVKRIKADCGAWATTSLLDHKALRTLIGNLRDEDAKPATINRYISRWSHLLSWCRAEYQLTGKSPFYDKHHNPTGIRKETEGDGRSRRLKTKPNEEALLIAAAEKLDDGGMMLGRLFCAIDAGLRRGEMLSLRNEDVLTNHNGYKGFTLHVRWTTCKTKKERYVPVTSARLTAFLKERRKRFAAFPFGQADGTRVDGFRLDWERLLLNSKLADGRYIPRQDGDAYGRWELTTDPDLHWHDLRHECGSRLAGKGVPLHEIKTLLGHADLKTTQKYLNATFSSLAENMKAAHRKLGV